MTLQQSNASLLSRFLALAVPLLLAAYWPLLGAGYAVHAGVIITRLSVLAAVALLSLLWIGGSITRAELKWAALFAFFLFVMLIPTLLGDDVSRGIHNWLRVLPVYCAAVLLARPLRHKATREAFGIALGIAGAASFLFILAIYLHYAGLSIPTYERIRLFKSVVQRSSGIALNPLASATLLFCVLSLCLLRSRLWHRAIVVAIAILSSALTGSRAPLALALAAAVALLIANLLHNRTIVVRAIAWAIICFTVAGASILGSFVVTPQRVSAATEGRYDLWTVGVEKFLERPLVGYGAESWHDDLASHLPNYYKGTAGLTTLRAGGYHSEFITLLAEGGLVCFIPAMIIFALLYRSSCRIAFGRAASGVNGQAIVFAFFLFFFRAAVEVPGLFGYGEDVIDYLAAIFVAIVISQVSLLPKRERLVDRPSLFRAFPIAEQRV